MVSTRISVICGALALILLLSEFPGVAKAAGGCSCRRSPGRAASWRCLLVCGSVSMGDGRVSSLPVKRVSTKISPDAGLSDFQVSDSAFLHHILTAARHRTALEKAERLMDSIHGSSTVDDVDVFEDGYIS